MFCFVDRLDGVRAEEAETSPQQSPTPAQQGEMGVPPDILQVLERTGGGGRTRTYDLRIMRPNAPSQHQSESASPSENSGKVLQNPQPPRNKINYESEE